MRSVRIIGPGRAGGSLAGALSASGWRVVDPVRRGGDIVGAARGVDVVVVATPDAAVADVARAIDPAPDVVVVHLAGSLGLAALAPHTRVGALHPLAALPDAVVGAERLLAGAWFAVAGDPVVGEIAADLGGRTFTIADADRVRYHAAAVIASNHLVALLGQAQRVGATAGVPAEALLSLVRGTVDNVAALGAPRALTGPVVRGDRATIDAHLAALDPAERPAYEALVGAAVRLLSTEETR